MEHHLLPKKPTGEIPRVPYVCREAYDGGHFGEYPVRKGHSWLALSADSDEDYIKFNISSTAHLMDTKEQESFFQTWLSFGLLAVFFKSLFNPEDYTQVENDGTKYVTTAKLIPMMQMAYDTRFEYSQEDKAVRVVRGRKCLLHTFHAMSTANKDFDWRIKMSIMSITELLARSMNEVTKRLGITMVLPAPEFYFPEIPNPLLSAMLSSGWCHSDIPPLTDKFASFHSLYYLSKLDKATPERDHSRCGEDVCSHLQIDLSTYQTKHTQPDCPCQSTGVNDERVQQILFDGAIPLLKFNVEGKTTEVEVIPSTSTIKYVAISHVWADGLGNPNNNTLPNCQITRIARLINAVREKIITAMPDLDSEPFYIWIDTLCCPVKPLKAKRLAISRLRDTYTNATAVLVLDASLESVDTEEMAPTEILMRIFVSAWARRLWTLQEGVLSKTLWLKFQRTILNFDAISVYMQSLNDKDMRSYCMYQDLAAHCAWLRDPPTRHKKGDVDSQRDRFMPDFRSIDLALQYRSTSVASDEALCLCTLLDLPVEDVLQVRAETDTETAQTRMARFWNLVARKYGGIPQSIAFLRFPRIELPGYRWAPRTLLSDTSHIKGSRSLQRLAYYTDPKFGVLTPEGLVCRWPGVLLRQKSTSTSRALLNPQSQIGKAQTGPVWVHSTDGAVRGLFSQGLYDGGSAFIAPRDRGRKIDHALLSSGRYAVAMAVRRDERFHREVHEGLLGTFERSGDDGVVRFVAVAHVVVSPPMDLWRRIYDAVSAVAERMADFPLDGSASCPAGDGWVSSADGFEREVSKQVGIEVERAPGLLAAVRGPFRDHPGAEPVKILQDMVKQRLLYEVEGEMLGDETEWCLS